MRAARRRTTDACLCRQDGERAAVRIGPLRAGTTAALCCQPRHARYYFALRCCRPLSKASARPSWCGHGLILLAVPVSGTGIGRWRPCAASHVCLLSVDGTACRRPLCPWRMLGPPPRRFPGCRLGGTRATGSTHHQRAGWVAGRRASARSVQSVWQGVGPRLAVRGAAPRAAGGRRPRAAPPRDTCSPPPAVTWASAVRRRRVVQPSRRRCGIPDAARRLPCVLLGGRPSCRRLGGGHVCGTDTACVGGRGGLVLSPSRPGGEETPRLLVPCAGGQEFPSCAATHRPGLLLGSACGCLAACTAREPCMGESCCPNSVGCRLSLGRRWGGDGRRRRRRGSTLPCARLAADGAGSVLQSDPAAIMEVTRCFGRL